MVARIVAQLIVPVGAIVLALVVGAIVIIITSPLVKGTFDPLLPLATYGALVQGSLGSFSGIVDTIVNATPLILVGLAVGLCFRAGLFNIGGQGQFLMGAAAAAAVGAALADSPPIIAVPLALIGAVVAGALYGFIPGVLKAFTGAHEVVTTIMLNYIAGFVIAYLVLGPLRAMGSSFARSPDVGNAALPVVLNQGTGHEGHIGIIFPILAIIVVYILLYRTTIGFELRTVGASPDAARYAGMRPRYLTILALTAGGMLAGLAGATEILGVTGYMAATYSTNVGFEAITVALLGRANPIGILFAGLLLGGMRAGAGLMQIQAGVPVQMIDVLQWVILLFLAADVIVRRVFRIRNGGHGVTGVGTVTRSYAGKTPAGS